MSNESLYRRNAIGNFQSVFLSRYGLLKQPQHLSGKSIQSRTPAYIKIYGTCNACSGGGTRSLPVDKETWDELYKANFKPSPILESVSLSFAGDWGVAKKITANIKCFDLGSFQYVQKYFLTPGNFISVEFGYSPGNQWNPPDDSVHSLSGFRVATFSFTAGDGGTWIGTFTAVSASEAIKALEMKGGINYDGSIVYIVAGIMDSERKVPVSGIAELIASDAQRNGTQKLNEIKKSTSGYLISEFLNYTKTPGSEVDATMVIYTDDHLHTAGGNAVGQVKKFIKTTIGQWDDAADSVHEIYVSLGYVVDRIVNGQVKKMFDENIEIAEKDKDFLNLKIKFSPLYSHSSIPKNLTSGDPTSVLILGATDCRYEDIDSPSIYMDFNEIKVGDKNLVKAWDGTVLRTDRILIHRSVVLGALKDSAKERPTESETVDPKDSKDTVVNLNDFFQSIFGSIKTCTGGAVSLKLVIDPDDKAGLTYLVVDQNYAGNKKINCYIFNPIDGDGNTRECNISSNGGSNEYRTSMFLANSKKGDVAATVRDCKDKLEEIRANGYDKALGNLLRLTQVPGNIMKDKFDSKQMDALISVMVDFYRYAPKSHNTKENINWPGMEIDLTINGAYGIIPGCAISTTQMPRKWLSDGVYFMVREVTHNFQNSDWTTNIRGIMALYDHLSPVPGS